jgi:hypothetical protein
VAAQDGAALDLVHVWQAPFDGLPKGDRGAPSGPQHAQLADALWLIEHQHAAALESLAADYRDRVADGNLHLVRGAPAAFVSPVQ